MTGTLEAELDMGNHQIDGVNRGLVESEKHFDIYRWLLPLIVYIDLAVSLQTWMIIFLGSLTITNVITM